MKKHKGEIATLLTLGLVIVGTLITLGTSLFVSNKKTNLATNSRASTNVCTVCNCGLLNGTYPNNPCYTRAGLYWKTAGCPGANIDSDGFGNVCNKPNINSGGGGVATGDACSLYGGNCVSQSFSSCDQVGGEPARSYCLSKAGQKCCKSSTLTQPPSNNDGTSGIVADNGVPNPEAACCFASNAQSANQCATGVDYVRVYARAAARVANEMTTPCTSAAYGNAYGASKWFYCADNTVDGCENGEGYDLTVPVEAPVNACEKKEGYRCKTITGKGDAYAACSPLQYVRGVSCGDTTKVCCKPVVNSNNNRTGKNGELCLYASGSKTYYCSDPKATCTPNNANGKCVVLNSGGSGGVIPGAGAPAAGEGTTTSAANQPNATVPTNTQCLLTALPKLIDGKQVETGKVGTKVDVTINRYLEETSLHYVSRYRKSDYIGSCGYDCINKNTNTREDCWKFQVNDNSTLLINNISIQNGGSKKITITGISFFSSYGLLVKNYYDMPANDEVIPGEMKNFNFVGTTVQCYADITKTKLTVTVQYKVDNIIKSTSSVTFDCEDDFNGFIKITET